MLLTRAADRLGPLSAGCRALGLEPVALPCLEIEWLDTDLPVDPGALAIFTSVYAVRGAARLRPLPWPGVRALGIGAATAGALSDAGQSVLAPPVEPYTSEALLGWLVSSQGPALGTDVLVIGGRGGRETLVRGLAAAGANARSLEVYRRVRPQPSRDAVARALSSVPDVTCTTSDEGLDNLLAIAGPYAPPLLDRPLVVNGERAATHARGRGFRGDVLVASPAGDGGQLAALRRWAGPGRAPWTGRL